MKSDSIDINNTGGTSASNTKPMPPKARELLSDQADGRPVWIRSPKQGVEFYTGFSRAKLYEGAGKGYFRSVSIRAPGQVRGTRLFHLQSILDFISKCEQQGMAQ
jgi:guanyl-specific ribonuclease Sa